MSSLVSVPMIDQTRESARLFFARQALQSSAIELERASMDAGFRSYWRTAGIAPSCVVMDSPPDKENVAPWLMLRAVFEQGGVRVPKVLAEDIDNGFLLLEDLGKNTLLQVIDANNADSYFDAAIDQLLRIQRISVPTALPAYDEALLARELKLFDEWFIGRHLNIILDCNALENLDLVYRRLIDIALAQPRSLVHRDFMPRNLMPAGDTLAVLDFQDAVIGPIAYDPICLFKDAFLSWPEERVQDWLARYHQRAIEAGLAVGSWSNFIRAADFIGVHRHLKVIGIFARLHHRDGKSKYLADAPRFFNYLDAVLPRYRELAPLQQLIEQQIKPVFSVQ